MALLSLLSAIAAIVPLTGVAIELGTMQLSRAYAPTPHVVFRTSPRFFFESGGVAFTQIAKGLDGYVIEHASYIPTDPDGARLHLVFTDGRHTRQIVPTLYDWELIPIVQFVAAGNGDSVVTLFGHLEDKTVEKTVSDRDDKIINYHPAFDNTLMGLRLLQADLLLMDPESAHIFSEGDTQIVGAGEKAYSAHDLRINHQALVGIETAIEQVIANEGPYQSYVVGDVDMPIEYRIGEASIEFIQSPRWYFWKFSKQAQQASIEAELRLGIRRLQRMPLDRAELSVALWTLAHQDEERTALHNIWSTLKAAVRTNGARESTHDEEIISRAVIEERKLDMVLITNLRQLYAARSDGGSRSTTMISSQSAYLQSISDRVDELSESDANQIAKFWGSVSQSPELTQSVESVPVEHMLSMESISVEIAKRNGVNPIVYRALSDGMHYSALFRELKTRDHIGMSNLAAQLANVKVNVISPPGYVLSTPSIYPHRKESEVSQLLH